MSKSKFGLDLPISAGSSAWDESLNFERMKEVTRICEALGFESVWAPDHLMDETLEVWTVLAGLSQVTETMRLGALVNCTTHRNPALLAKIAATLDVMSNGRVDLGIGAGWNGYEQLAYGLPWEEIPKARVERLVEAVRIIRGLWTADDRFTFKGKYYNVNGAKCLPKPVQKPCPKILIGGKGEKLLLRAVARYADAWNIDELTTSDYAHKLQVLQDHCKAVGTDYTKIEKTLETYLLISDRPEQQQRLVDWTNEHSASSPERKRLGKQPMTVKLEDIRKEYIFGSVKEVTDRFADYIKVGVQRFMIYFMDYPTLNSILPFAKQVVPSLD
jgi:alkanesulfonate monooxygenase SsuD/methylene tetrahydromethanopterin reductase-like flavin-dependent oxidoreductase (luciferase family)